MATDGGGWISTANVYARLEQVDYALPLGNIGFDELAGLQVLEHLGAVLVAGVQSQQRGAQLVQQLGTQIGASRQCVIDVGRRLVNDGGLGLQFARSL